MPPRYPKEFSEDVVRIALDRGPRSHSRKSRKTSESTSARSTNGSEKNASNRARNPVLRVQRMLSCVSFANGTSFSNKKSRCSVVRPRISRRRTCRERLYPLVKELACDGIPVQVSCRVLKLSRQPYYRWLRSTVTARDLTQAYRANVLHDAHLEDPEFEYRFLADEAKTLSEVICDRTAWRR